MGYQRGFDWENWVVETYLDLLILAAIIGTAVAITAIWVTLRELVGIFARRAFQPTTAARVLWIAVAVLISLWFAAGLLTGVNQTAAAITLYLAAWATLGFIILAEFIDVRASGLDGQQGDPEALDSYIDFTTPTPAAVNGNTPAGVA